MPQARLARILGIVAALLFLAGWWSRPAAPTRVSGTVVAVTPSGGGRGGISGGRVVLQTAGGTISVFRDDASRYRVGTDVTIVDESGGAAATVLLGAAAATGLGAVGSSRRARWMRRALEDGWHPAHLRLERVAVLGRERTIAWVDGTAAEPLGLRRLDPRLGPTAMIAGDPSRGRFVLQSGRRLLPMRPLRRARRR